MVTIGIWVPSYKTLAIPATTAEIQVCKNPRLDIADPAMSPKGESAPAVAWGNIKLKEAIKPNIGTIIAQMSFCPDTAKKNIASPDTKPNKLPRWINRFIPSRPTSLPPIKLNEEYASITPPKAKANSWGVCFK